MITLFCVRPRGFNVGNDTIFLGLRHLIRQTFGGLVNIVQVPAMGTGRAGELSGLLPRSIHEMNLYGHGVIVGGGNLYENGQLEIDPNALAALHPPLMLFSLSRGRIYDNRHDLVSRTDATPDALLRALHERAGISLARDEATFDYLHGLGVDTILGGCPSLLVRQLSRPQDVNPPANGSLLSVRHPRLMSIPLRDQARLHATIVDLMAMLEADGFGPVRILCHDTRDVEFASSLGDVDFILADDVYSQLELLRTSPLVVSFRLHAFLPCVSFGTPAINISYDERSRSLVRTIGMESWDIDFIRSRDVVQEVRDRCSRLGDLGELRTAVQPLWERLESTMREQMAAFASLVYQYEAQRPPAPLH
jgi:hypothetical protein